MSLNSNIRVPMLMALNNSLVAFFPASMSIGFLSSPLDETVPGVVKRYNELRVPRPPARTLHGTYRGQAKLGFIHIKIKSSSYSRFCVEANNEWRGLSPRLGGRATQFRRNGVAATLCST